MANRSLAEDWTSNGVVDRFLFGSPVVVQSLAPRENPSQEQLAMFDQVFDNFRKATETTLQAQQDLFRQWMTQWPMYPAAPPHPAAPRL